MIIGHLLYVLTLVLFFPFDPEEKVVFFLLNQSISGQGSIFIKIFLKMAYLLSKESDLH